MSASTNGFTQISSWNSIFLWVSISVFVDAELIGGLTEINRTYTVFISLYVVCQKAACSPPVPAVSWEFCDHFESTCDPYRIRVLTQIANWCCWLPAKSQHVCRGTLIRPELHTAWEDSVQTETCSVHPVSPVWHVCVLDREGSMCPAGWQNYRRGLFERSLWNTHELGLVQTYMHTAMVLHRPLTAIAISLLLLEL